MYHTTFLLKSGKKIIHTRNTTGILGVRIDERNKWESRLCVNGKNMRLGRFNTKEEAIIARLKAEKYYLGEFAPQKHLFAEYGI